MKPTPRSLILGTLLASEGEPLSARDAINACALFKISENNVRVALVRLSSDGMIEAAGRGTYRLGPKAEDLANDVATWRAAEQRLRQWNGGWIAVHVGNLGRSDRRALRTRDRALAMLGLRELDRGLFVRPDNLTQGVAAVRERLHKLGLDAEASVFVAHDFDATREVRIRKLWDGKSLTSKYKKTRAQLESWMERAPALEHDVAARESYLMGSKAIREVVFDPLLPEPFVDTKERHAFIETVRRFDRFGQAIWRNTGTLPLESTAISAHMH